MPDTHNPAPDVSERRMLSVAWDHLTPSDLNPRGKVNAERVAELAESIAERGLLQNLVARPAKKAGTYEIVAGESRWRAIAKLVADKRIAADYRVAVLVEPQADRDVIETALAENIQRKDLEPLEEAAAFKRLVGLGATTAEIALRVGKTQRFVQLRLDLLQRLAPEARKALNAGVIGVDVARELARAPSDKQGAILKQVTPNKHGEARLDSAREIRRAVQQAMIPVSRAAFDLALYKGEILDDPDAGRCFADAAQFERLQKAHVESLLADLRKRFHWAACYEAWDAERIAYPLQENKTHERRGAVVLVNERSGKLQVHENVVDVTNPARGGRAQASYSGRKEPAKPKPGEFNRERFLQLRRDILRDYFRKLRQQSPEISFAALLADEFLPGMQDAFGGYGDPQAVQKLVPKGVTGAEKCAQLRKRTRAQLVDMLQQLAVVRLSWPYSPSHEGPAWAIIGDATAVMPWATKPVLRTLGPAQLGAIALELKLPHAKPDQLRAAIAKAARARPGFAPIYFRTGLESEWRKLEKAAQAAAPKPAAAKKPAAKPVRKRKA